MTADYLYLDHAATTPLRPQARAAIDQGFALWANPSSPHGQGRAARAALEDARERVRITLDWDGEVIFTSGASEAASMAMSRAKGGDRFVSAVEHDAMMAASPKAARVPVLPNGAVDTERLALVLRTSASPVVAIQSINSETGNIQDHAILSQIVHDAGGMLIADCAQSAGRYPLPAGPDMVIISAHKFGGPVGVGALLVRGFGMLAPDGGQERGYRRGTENLPGVLGMAAALAACAGARPDDYLGAAINSLAAQVRSVGGKWLADSLAAPTAYVHAIAMPGVSASAQLMRFDLARIAISQGSACSSGSMRRSGVLSAMGLDDDLTDRTIRMSVGWTTTPADVDRFAAAWLAIAGQARAA